MKKLIEGLAGVTVLLAAMVFIAWLETPEATPFIVGTLKALAILLVVALAAVALWVHKKKKVARYRIESVRHEGIDGYSLYIVVMDGYGKVVDYEIQQEFVGLDEQALAAWKPESLSLEEARDLVK